MKVVKIELTPNILAPQVDIRNTSKGESELIIILDDKKIKLFINRAFPRGIVKAIQNADPKIEIKEGKDIKW